MDTKNPPLPTLNKFLEDREYDYLTLAMEVSHGVVKQAARIAGREPGRFYKKLLDYGIKARDYRGIYHGPEWHAAHKKQRGFATLIVYAVIALAALAALGGIYATGYRSGSQAKQVQWDEANRDAQAKADEERRSREATARAESVKLQSAQARARDAETRWRASRADAGPLAAVECPAGAGSPPEAPGSVAAVTGGAEPAAPVVRVTGAFVGLFDGAWTGRKGEPVFPDSGRAAEAPTAPGPTIGRVLDVHAENAARCSETSRTLNGLIDLIEQLRAR